MEINHNKSEIKFIGSKRSGFYYASTYEPDKARMVDALKIVLSIKPKSQSDSLKD